jgi:hypothetical protein
MLKYQTLKVSKEGLDYFWRDGSLNTKFQKGAFTPILPRRFTLIFAKLFLNVDNVFQWMLMVDWVLLYQIIKSNFRYWGCTGQKLKISLQISFRDAEAFVNNAHILRNISINYYLLINVNMMHKCWFLMNVHIKRKLNQTRLWAQNYYKCGSALSSTSSRRAKRMITIVFLWLQASIALSALTTTPLARSWLLFWKMLQLIGAVETDWTGD